MSRVYVEMVLPKNFPWEVIASKEVTSWTLSAEAEPLAMDVHSLTIGSECDRQNSVQQRECKKYGIRKRVRICYSTQ
jgi:hypothetical protein